MIRSTKYTKKYRTSMDIPASLRPTHGPMHVMPARGAMSGGSTLANLMLLGSTPQRRITGVVDRLDA
jgi:hypothetical protein